MSWLKAINPGAPINGEAEAKQAARASALAIFIGVIVGAFSVGWTYMNMDQIVAAAEAAGGAAMAGSIVQTTLWTTVALAVIQLVFGIVQWRDPKKFIAILFIVLIILGLLMTLAAPMMASMAPAGTPPTPMWQIALSGGIMVIQVVLHVAGLRGIKKLDAIQMDSAR